MTLRQIFQRAPSRSACPDRPADLVCTSSDGYRLMRWYSELIEILEHRWLTDAPSGMHVHHINGDTQDNRLENLEVLTPSEHQERHTAERRTVPDSALLAMYEQGLTTTQIAALVRLDSSNVFRRLRAAGCTFRPSTHNRVEMDEAEVLRRHDEGDRANWIAEALSVPVASVRRVLRQNGRRGTAGRPPQRERTS